VAGSLWPPYPGSHRSPTSHIGRSTAIASDEHTRGRPAAHYTGFTSLSPWGSYEADGGVTRTSPVGPAELTTRGDPELPEHWLDRSLASRYRGKAMPSTGARRCRSERPQPDRGKRRSVCPRGPTGVKAGGGARRTGPASAPCPDSELRHIASERHPPCADGQLGRDGRSPRVAARGRRPRPDRRIGHECRGRKHRAISACFQCVVELASPDARGIITPINQDGAEGSGRSCVGHPSCIPHPKPQVRGICELDRFKNPHRRLRHRSAPPAR
jgi:hypothetical protein